MLNLKKRFELLYKKGSVIKLAGRYLPLTIAISMLGIASIRCIFQSLPSDFKFPTLLILAILAYRIFQVFKKVKLSIEMYLIGSGVLIAEILYYCLFVSWVLGLIIFIVCMILAYLYKDKLANERVPMPKAQQQFSGIFGRFSLLPTMLDAAFDKFQRLDLANDMAEFIHNLGRTQCRVIGLSGIWGIGKTSMLRTIETQLQHSNVKLLKFNSWDYRTAEKFISHFFHTLAKSIVPDFHFVSKYYLYKLASQLMPSSFSWIGLQFSLGNLFHISEKSAENSLAEDLKQATKPFVVFIDDLDRLERDELNAVLNSVRLLSDLPNLVFVLAYDKQHIFKTLFPGESEQYRARDFLAKIIHTELSVTVAEQIKRQKYLSDILAEVGKHLPRETLEQFNEELYFNSAAIFYALPTPREIIRVLETTVWLYTRLQDELNLFELFILTIIQYRYPSVYHDMQLKAYYFYNVAWSSSSGFYKQDEVKAEQKAYLEELFKEQKNAYELVFILLGFHVEDMKKTSSVHYQRIRRDALKESRIIHPLYYPVYFKQAAFEGLRYSILQSTMQNYLDAKSGIDKQQLLINILQDFIAKGYLSDLVLGSDFWELFIELISVEASAKADGTLKLSEETIWHIAIAFARLAEKLPTHTTIAKSIRTQAVYRTMELLARVKSDKKTNQLALKIIQEATVLGFAGILIFYINNPERGKRYLGDRNLDKQQLNMKLVDRANSLLRDKSLLDEDDEGICSLVFWVDFSILNADKQNMVKDLFFKSLQNYPHLLPKLLNLIAKRELPDDGYSFTRSGIDTLEQRFGLKAINEITKAIDVDALNTDSIELTNRYRALIKAFRNYVHSL